jgi:Toprim domain
MIGGSPYSNKALTAHDLKRIALALGGRPDGSGWRARCPAHQGADRNLSLWVDDGGLGLKCWSHNCSRRDILYNIIGLGLLPDHRGGHDVLRSRHTDERRNWKSEVLAQKLPGPLDSRPLWLFEKALQIEGTPAANYLTEVRGSLILPPHKAVRFIPAQPPHFPWPAMVSLVTDFADASRVLTLHFTDLLPDGSGKAPITPAKRTLKGCPTKGGVVRLTDDAEVMLRLGIAEGIETSLSVMTAFQRDESRVEHVWCALNAGNLGDLPVVPGIETLVIYADRGRAGEHAADKLARRWLDADREVVVVTAPVDDWNPVVP